MSCKGFAPTLTLVCLWGGRMCVPGGWGMPQPPDFGAQIGMTADSTFWAGSLRARRLRPIGVLYRNIATSP